MKRMIETIKTFILEYKNIKDYINKKTNERLAVESITKKYNLPKSTIHEKFGISKIEKYGYKTK
jgi:hypothetical protein